MPYNLRPEYQSMVLAATQTKSAATNVYEDVPTFHLPVMASTLYRFEFNIIFQSPATNRGLGLSVNGPASPKYVLIRTEIPSSLTSATQGMARAYNTGTATTAVDALNTNCHARCYGFFSNGTTAGDLALSFVSNNTGGAVQIMAGSTMGMWRLSPIN